MLNITLIKGENLRLGDVVRQWPVNLKEPFNELTVTNINQGTITFYRHYTHLADFTYTGGVIAYVGISTFDAQANSPMEYELVTNIFRERQ